MDVMNKSVRNGDGCEVKEGQVYMDCDQQPWIQHQPQDISLEKETYMHCQSSTESFANQSQQVNETPSTEVNKGKESSKNYAKAFVRNVRNQIGKKLQTKQRMQKVNKDEEINRKYFRYFFHKTNTTGKQNLTMVFDLACDSSKQKIQSQIKQLQKTLEIKIAQKTIQELKNSLKNFILYECCHQSCDKKDPQYDSWAKQVLKNLQRGQKKNIRLVDCDSQENLN